MQLLSEHDTATLRAAPLTYSRDESAGDRVPLGYRHFRASTSMARRDLDGAARDLLGLRMHEKAGLRVRASDVTARPGAVVLLRLGVGPLSLRIPCRVVEVFDEPCRKGFAYGTLPGHPESGEERFVLDQDADGTIRFTVAGFSTPATFLARAGGPVSRATQAWMTRRYLAALDRLAGTARP